MDYLDYCIESDEGYIVEFAQTYCVPLRASTERRDIPNSGGTRRQR